MGQHQSTRGSKLPPGDTNFASPASYGQGWHSKPNCTFLCSTPPPSSACKNAVQQTTGKQPLRSLLCPGLQEPHDSSNPCLCCREHIFLILPGRCFKWPCPDCIGETQNEKSVAVFPIFVVVNTYNIALSILAMISNTLTHYVVEPPILSISRTLYLVTLKSVSINNSSTYLSSPRDWQPPFYFVWLWLFQVLQVDGIVQYCLLW